MLFWRCWTLLFITSSLFKQTSTTQIIMHSWYLPQKICFCLIFGRCPRKPYRIEWQNWDAFQYISYRCVCIKTVYIVWYRGGRPCLMIIINLGFESCWMRVVFCFGHIRFIAKSSPIIFVLACPYDVLNFYTFQCTLSTV